MASPGQRHGGHFGWAGAHRRRTRSQRCSRCGTHHQHAPASRFSGRRGERAAAGQARSPSARTGKQVQRAEAAHPLARHRATRGCEIRRLVGASRGLSPTPRGGRGACARLQCGPRRRRPEYRAGRAPPPPLPPEIRYSLALTVFGTSASACSTRAKTAATSVEHLARGESPGHGHACRPRSRGRHPSGRPAWPLRVSTAYGPRQTTAGPAKR